MRKLPAAAQEERRRQVIGLRQRGMTYQEIADLVGLSRTGVFNICQRYRNLGVAGLRRFAAVPAAVELVQDVPAGVVAGVAVTGAGVTEADDRFHDSLPDAAGRCLSPAGERERGPVRLNRPFLRGPP